MCLFDHSPLNWYSGYSLRETLWSPKLALFRALFRVLLHDFARNANEGYYQLVVHVIVHVLVGTTVGEYPNVSLDLFRRHTSPLSFEIFDLQHVPLGTMYHDREDEKMIFHPAHFPQIRVL
jgi:hypothetical protein